MKDVATGEGVAGAAWLDSRHGGMDALVVFDGVFAPWENVFLCRGVKACNSALRVRRIAGAF